MKFNKKKGRKQLCREDLGILMGSKLNRTWCHDLVATEANKAGLCEQEHSQQVERRDFPALLCASETVDPHKRETKELEGAQSRTTEVVGSGAHDIPGKAARAGCVLTEKRRLREAPIDSNCL